MADRRRRDQSSTPSPCSSPEMRHTVVSSHPQGGIGMATALPPQVATRVEREKPPIPPRNSSIRTSASFDVPDGGGGSSVKSKIQMFQQSAHGAAVPAPPPSYSGMLPSRGSSHAGMDAGYFKRICNLLSTRAIFSLLLPLQPQPRVFKHIRISALLNYLGRAVQLYGWTYLWQLFFKKAKLTFSGRACNNLDCPTVKICPTLPNQAC